jgi:hypothetical protein
MRTNPQPPRRKFHLLPLIAAIIPFVVIATFVGMNMSQRSEMKGGTPANREHAVTA